MYLHGKAHLDVKAKVIHCTGHAMAYQPHQLHWDDQNYCHKLYTATYSRVYYKNVALLILASSIPYRAHLQKEVEEDCSASIEGEAPDGRHG